MKLEWSAFEQSFAGLVSALVEQTRIEADPSTSLALRSVVLAGVIRKLEIV